MAAAIKALNAKIRSNPYTDYICSTRELPREDKPLISRRILRHNHNHLVLRSPVTNHATPMLT